MRWSVVLFLLSSAIAQDGIVRVAPSRFPGLPADIVRELTRRRCRIPQHTYSKELNNAVRGEFARAGQKDWAVLCSVHGESTILVFWNGAAQSPGAIAKMPDRNFSNGKEFARSIDRVDRRFILEHYRVYGGPKPPPIRHHGINDAFLEKASIVWYFYRGKWLQLQGAD